ncbi:hypothetical protein V8C34DRAFT_165685 [Trichoderma compactum]
MYVFLTFNAWILRVSPLSARYVHSASSHPCIFLLRNVFWVITNCFYIAINEHMSKLQHNGSMGAVRLENTNHRDPP